MNAGELLDLFRTEVVDTVVPYLWSDDFILSTISDAQVQFARHTDGIPDSTTDAVTLIELVASTGVYALHDKVLKIRSAYRTDTGRAIDMLNVEDMAPRKMYFDGREGTTTALITGMDENSVRAYPVPAEAFDIRLSTFRLPLVAITDGDDPLVVPDQHQRPLLMWMKHLAYGVHDTEAFDRTKSEEFAQAFKAYCASAKVDQGRARHKPRAVAYGGL